MDKKYKVIYADPPWRYRDRNPQGAAERHYGTMTTAELCKLPVEKLAETDCALFLWTTGPMLPEALRVITEWGFAFKTIAFNWVKTTGGGHPKWPWTLHKKRI